MVPKRQTSRFLCSILHQTIKIHPAPVRNTKSMTQLTSEVWPYLANWFCVWSYLFQSPLPSTWRLKWREKSSDGHGHGKVADEPQASREARACLWWKGWAGQRGGTCGKCVCSVTQLCTALRPCGRWPARLLCPWDHPGKNTKVGCTVLLQGIFPTQGSNPKLLYLSLPVTSGKPPGNGYTGRVSGDTVEPRKGYQKQGGEGSRRQARLLASTERLKQVTGWWGRVEGMSASPDSHCLLTSALFMHVS